MRKLSTTSPESTSGGICQRPYTRSRISLRYAWQIASLWQSFSMPESRPLSPVPSNRRSDTPDVSAAIRAPSAEPVTAFRESSPLATTGASMSTGRERMTGPAASILRGPALARPTRTLRTSGFTRSTSIGWTWVGTSAKTLTLSVTTSRFSMRLGASLSSVGSTSTLRVWSRIGTGITRRISGWATSLKCTTEASMRRRARTLRLSFGGSGWGSFSSSMRTTMVSSCSTAIPSRASRNRARRMRCSARESRISRREAFCWVRETKGSKRGNAAAISAPSKPLPEIVFPGIAV